MEYLLLWSGDVQGMEKARIPTAPCCGVLHSIGDDDAAVVPDRDAIRDAIPHRLRVAFDRAQLGSIARPGQPVDSSGRQWPLLFDLISTRGKWLTRLYLQPLTSTQAK